MRINTNVSSLTAQANASETNKMMSSSLEKLSSGLAINKAADDASGLSIADKLRTQASSLSQSVSNGNSASALIQIADAAMSEQSSILDTVKTKLLQAATATTTEEGREAIRKDVTKLLEQVDNIASQTNYNGLTLLQQSSTDTAVADEFTFQLGENAEFDVSLTQTNASNTSHLGGGSEVFGATSITSLIAAADINTANAVNGEITSGDKASNNIAIDGSQQLNTTGVISIAGISIAGDSTEALDGVIDITISGTIGKIVGEGALTFDASSETTTIQNSLEDIAGNNSDFTYDSATDTFKLAAGASVDFGSISFSSLDTESNTAKKQISLNVGGRTDDDNISVSNTFTITNNAAANTEAEGNNLTPSAEVLNIHTNSTTGGQLTGGLLLSNLKDLGEGELTNALANDFLDTVDAAITQLDANRADFGSSQNQIQSSITSMTSAVVNLEAAESVIRDVDYAEESANFSKQNIISQAGTYAMSQANSVQSNIMKLLQ